ncbi:YhgE/Pip domain-containing protein [Clostridium sp.]|uniref:YhgE/Pip domain-containing protein n=1 Tax=Clostridium sp. TaxID=1506 RepID=UPI002FCA7EFF
MKFAKIAWKDISSIFKNRFIRVSVVAIIIVPLLYSLLYLAAFWDPYARLQELPVAFVNLDKGGTKDGEAVNYGEDILENLKDNKEVQWHFVKLEEGKSGLESDGYYSMFVIPEDFSRKIISAKDGKPQQPSIVYSANEKKNFLAAQIGGRVEDKLKAEIVQNVSEEYTKVTFDNLYQLKDGMRKAADGSKELSDGISTLNNKVPEMADGVNQLYDGSTKLSEGLGKLNSNSSQMEEGVGKLYSGSSQLKDGINSLNENTPSMVAGINILYDGTNKLSEGLNTTAVDSNGKPLGLTYGLKGLLQGIKQVKDSVGDLGYSLQSLNNDVNVGSPNSPSLVQGVSSINKGVSGISAALSAFNNTVNNGAVPSSNGMSTDQVIGALTKQYNSATDDTVRVQVLAQMVGVLNSAVNVDKGATEPSLKTAMGALNNSVNVDSEGKPSLKTAIEGLNAAVNNGYSGKPSLISGMDTLVSGTDNLANGAGEIGEGASQLKGGLEQLKGKMPQLTEGTNSLASGATALNGGLSELKVKMPELVSGVNQLSAGSKALNVGLGELNNKIPELKDGSEKLRDGSIELSEKLNEGADELDKNLVNSSEDMAKFVSEPIVMKDDAVNAVKDYGTGFTSYFIPLSLWVGAIMMFFVISSKVGDSMDAGPIATVLGKYLSYGFIGTLQAVLVSIAVLALGLKPQNLLLYFLFNILMSLSFIAIIQCLIFSLGDAGRLLAIVLLILQLTSCAGTFPLELVPQFFKVINPYMPFTYCVSALREIISGNNLSLIGHDILILSVILVVFLGISMLLKERGELLQLRMEERKEVEA